VGATHIHKRNAGEEEERGEHSPSDGTTPARTHSHLLVSDQLQMLSRNAAERASVRHLPCIDLADVRDFGSTVRKAKSKIDMKANQREELLRALQARFEKNMSRHEGLEWAAVQAKLEASAEKLGSLHEMETTGGEPDVVGHDQKTGEYIFYDCSAESPGGRRSVCYDREGLESRKEHRPENSKSWEGSMRKRRAG
jgi:hypothetical protein